MLSEVLNQHDSLIVISAPIVTIIMSLLIPLINGLLTKYTVSGAVKGVITLLMNTVMAFITTNASDTGAALFSLQTLMTATLGFIVSVATYAGIYRPAKITSSTPDGKLGPTTGVIG